MRIFIIRLTEGLFILEWKR